MAVQTSAGCKIFIGTTSVSSPDTFLEVGEVTNFSEFGRVYQLITHQSIGTRGDRKFKGSFNDGDITLQLGRDPQDAGQAACIAARESDEDYYFKVELNDDTQAKPVPTTFLFQGKVMSYTTNIGGPNQVVGATLQIAITSGTITEVAAN